MFFNFNSINQRFCNASELNSRMMQRLIDEDDMHFLLDRTSNVDFRESYALVLSYYTFDGIIQDTDCVVTLSARNRYMYWGSIDPGDDNIRDLDLVFFNRPFSPKTNTALGSITVGKYEFFFKYQNNYNTAIILMKWSDEEVLTRRIPSRRLDMAEFYLSDEITEKYNITVDDSQSTFKIDSYSYSKFDDFNYEDVYDKGSGLLTFYCACFQKRGLKNQRLIPLSDFIHPSNGMTKDNSWIWVSSQNGGTMAKNREFRKSFASSNMDYEDSAGLQFYTQDTADSLYIIGNPSIFHLAVVRLKKGWGGIQFKLTSLHDYYQLGAWLTVALSYYRNLVHGESVKDNINKYWPWYVNNCLSDEDSAEPIINNIGNEQSEGASELTMNSEELTGVRNTLFAVSRALELAQNIYNMTNTPAISDLDKLFEMECLCLLYAVRKNQEGLSDGELNFINSVFMRGYVSDAIKMGAESLADPTISMTPIMEFSIAYDNILAREGMGPESSLASMLYSFIEMLLGKSIRLNGSYESSIDAFEKIKNIQLSRINTEDFILRDPILPAERITSLHKSPPRAYPPVSNTPQPVGSTANIKSESQPTNESETVLIEELYSLIGLEEIKADVENLVSLVKIQKVREARGLKTVPVSLHLVFAGNPGTGKTTVARILAKLYKDLGVLKTGQLIEVDRSGLVAGYVGQTAIKTQEKIKEAIGGILFIDEAYTLAKDGNDFGQEAIDTILKAMEDRRDEFVVIVAGYTDLMAQFINSNPGLKSRFNKYFYFRDYTGDELVQIFDKMCIQYDYKITADAKKMVSEKIHQMEANKDSNFANARDVRNYFEQIITRQAKRTSANLSMSNDDVITITIDDV